MSFPPPPTTQPPPALKPVSHYLKVALEHDARDPVIAYWAFFAAVQKSLSIDRSSPDAKMFVIGLLDWLEKCKKVNNSANEAITVEAAGEAHIENYALKLFNWADGSDRGGVFNKNVVKAFYTAGILFDILESLRPPLSDEFTSARKYSKWKAAYIHNCLKNGEVPVPGGREDDGEEDEEDGEDNNVEQQQFGGGGGGAGGFSRSSGGGQSSSYGFVKPEGPHPQNNDYSFTPTQPTTIPPHQPPPTTDYYNESSNFPNPTNSFNQNVYAGGGAGSDVPLSDQFQPTANPNAAGGGGANTGGANSASLSVEKIAKAQKYCKWAGSALNFDDVASAVDNLEKALHLLKTGQDLG